MIGPSVLDLVGTEQTLRVLGEIGVILKRAVVEAVADGVKVGRRRRLLRRDGR